MDSETIQSMQSSLETTETLSVPVPRKVWTRQEAHKLVDLGFPNADKLELIQGDLISRMGKNRPHVVWQQLVHLWLIGVFGPDRVEIESPTDVSSEDNEINEPEPDLKVLKNPSRSYSSNPQPQDILLVVEISDSTLEFDRKIKARLYARAEILEYWVLDVKNRRLVVHRAPMEGVYSDVQIVAADEEVTPLSAPHASFSLDRL